MELSPGGRPPVGLLPGSRPPAGLLHGRTASRESDLANALGSRRRKIAGTMSAAEELFRKLSRGQGNAEQVAVRPDEAGGTVELEMEGTEARLDSDEARAFADDLEAYAKDEGWYHAGQTKPLVEEIRETAAAIE